MELTRSQIINALKCRGERQKDLHNWAAYLRDHRVSNNVYFRGLIEFSNVCHNDCYYCGIRKSNSFISRYTMSKEEILETVDQCDKANYGSVVLQSGERSDPSFVDFVSDTVSSIKADYPHLGITLCVGEQTKDSYKRFFQAGAHRYLLRIETSDPQYYNQIHPPEMNFERRKQCLTGLQEIGFQTGTGVLIGLPYQTLEHLANDLTFMKTMDIDMAGMGPYIPHTHTPLKPREYDPNENFQLGLNMIAVLRLLMPDINIASTTALDALDHNGKEKGLLAGANVMMPVMTPLKYRDHYHLYKDRPIETPKQELMDQALYDIGMNPCYGQWGDSLHYFKKGQRNHIL